MSSLVPETISSLFRGPLLNLPLHNYNHIPVLISAIKSFLFTRSLQCCPIEPKSIQVICALLTLSFILPNLPYDALLKPILNFGVIFTSSYVQTLTLLHGKNVFVLCDLLIFLACVLCKQFEFVFDVLISVVSVHELLVIRPLREIKMSVIQLVFSVIYFLVLWWTHYWFTFYYLLGKLMRVHEELCPRLFTNSLVFVLFYRLLGLSQVYI